MHLLTLPLYMAMVALAQDKQDEWGDTATFDKLGGVRLTYRLLWPEGFKGEKEKVGEQVMMVLMHRINSRALKEPHFSIQGNERVVIEIPGVKDRDSLADYEGLIKTIGKLELKEVATKEVHEKFNENDIVPAGYEKYLATDKTCSEDRPWIKDWILVESAAVIDGTQFTNVFYQAEIGQGWTVHFTLHDDASQAFDREAKELCQRTPKGQLAIIVDGKIISAPVVQAEAFHGQGQITGRFSEEEAHELAIVFKSGSLPVPIGSIEKDVAKVGVPEKVEFVGPK